MKNLGDGLMVVFGSASAALACAVAMQQGVERDNRDREHSVGLRVGLSGGEVSREDDDYFGDPVVEAARLCATCESGQILATDVVRAMAGRRSRHQCRSLGELTLKGLSEPVETVEVLWEPLGGDRHRHRDRRATAGVAWPCAPRLVWSGAKPRLQAMADAVKRVAGGEGREVVLISGEAGMGKTTLVAEAARAAFDNGACVLFGHCEEDLATPYQLFAEALRHYVTHAPEDQLLAHVEEYGSELARLVPALASRIPDLPPSKATDADTERYLLFAAVVGLLATGVESISPSSWSSTISSGPTTAACCCLRHLAAAEQAMRVLVLGTYRDSELSHSHPLTDTLGDSCTTARVSRIELAGLDDSGVVAFLEAAAGQTLDDAGVGLAHAVYRETDGNPFFVSEVLRHLAETGAIYQDATGRWTSEESLDQMALPDSVREVIGARVGRLGQDAERVLSMAAVIGRDFDLDLLARATKTTEDELLDILDAAAAAALVRELADTPGHYNFAHALIQHTLYEDLGLTRRARAHRQVGEALEELCGDDPEAGGRTGPPLGQCHPAHRPRPRPSATPARRATPPSVPSPPPMPCATTPRPSTSTPRPPTPIRFWHSTWPSGSAPPSARRGTRRFATPSSALLAGLPISTTPSDWWPPPWPTTEASSAPPVSSTPTRSRSWSWPSTGSQPTTPTGRSCSPPCVRNCPRKPTRTSSGAGRRGPRHRPVHR